MTSDAWAALLGALVGAVLGWIGALIQAGAAQDRERSIRQRSVARSLLAEVRRIRSELGDPSSIVGSIYGASPIVPVMHDWLLSLLPELADAS